MTNQELAARLVIAEGLATACLEVLIDRAPDVAAAIIARVRHHTEFATAGTPEDFQRHVAFDVAKLAARLEQQKPALRASNHTVPMLGVV